MGEKPEICSLTGGLQGRVEAITTDRPVVHGAVYVQRGNKTREAQVGCLLKDGDIVRPAAGTRVTLKLPDRQEKIVDFNHPMVVPAIRSPHYLDRVVRLLIDLAGADGSAARDIAIGTIGTTRSDPTMIEMPGMIGVGDQNVDGSRPLVLRWDGGVPPYRVELMATGPKARRLSAATVVSQPNVRLELKRLPSEDYDLTISCNGRVGFTLSVHLVGSTAVPAAAGIDPGARRQERELAAAVWLLTRGPLEWRLEAISRLEMLAADQNDLVAQIILDRALE